MTANTSGICQALNIADESHCTERATNSSGLFCRYHARQVQGLYSGYKKRNARLDALEAAPPAYLASSKRTLRNEDFSDVEDANELRELEDWLYERYRLIDRVILARKKHHTHFYAENLDYGHKSYLDKLVNDKNVVLLALNRLRRRSTHVNHKQKKWFAFVRECQEEEDLNQEKEVVKVKKEAQLFRRYRNEMEARMQRKQRREDKKRQEAFLNEAYEERLQYDEESSEEWDPIETIIKGERDDLVDLMHRLLWLERSQKADEPEPQEQANDSSSHNIATPSSRHEDQESPTTNMENVDPAPTTNSQGTKALSKNARKRAKAKAKAKGAGDTSRDDAKNNVADDGGPKIEVNETREEMRQRLVKGLSAKEHGGRAFYDMDDRVGVPFDIPGIPESEVDHLLDEVAEIKELLLCRLILSQSNLLPIGLRACNLTEFFADPELNLSDLRDLCLRYEQPKLQEIRDACADFVRGDGEASDDEDEDEDDEQTAHELAVQDKYQKDAWRRRRLEMRHRTKHEQNVEKKSAQRRQLAQQGFEKVIVDFGDIDKDGEFRQRKIRVRVCGKSIWNYPSEKVPARGGWYHFSVIAKNCRFQHAVELCRHWNEFWELSNLVIFNYFSSTTWVAQWSGQPTRTQQLQLGIISYLDFNKADQLTLKRQPGRRGFGGVAQPAIQFKNVTGFCIKRNDPISRRFVQYLSMQTRYVCLMVRDAKTGKTLVKPPEEHTWLMRVQGGLGRDDWVEKLHVGDDELYGLLEDRRSESWKFGFNDYYDVTVWDLLPGEHCNNIWSTVHEAMRKARRICDSMGFYDSVAPIMKTLHREVKESKEQIGRVRDARPGEITLYDEVSGSDGMHIYRDVDPLTGEFGETHYEQPANYFYNDVDAAEDLILFPDEAAGVSNKAITGSFAGDLAFPELVMPNMKRFVLDLDSDEDEQDMDDPFADLLDKRAIESQPAAPKQITAEEDWETEDCDKDWLIPPKDVPMCPNPNARDCHCPECQWWEQNDPVPLPSLEDGMKRDGMKRDGHAPITPLDVKASIKDHNEAGRLISFIFDEPSGDEDQTRDTESDFTVFMDREKSKFFKKMWHTAEFNDELRARWSEMQELVKERRVSVNQDIPSIIDALHILMWLGVRPEEHRRVLDDMWDAKAAMTFFFKRESGDAQHLLIDSNESANKERLTLSDNVGRAKSMEPHARSPSSNKTRTKDFWEGLDLVRKTAKNGVLRAWDVHCRPQVAQLARAGIVKPGYYPNPCGRATATAETGLFPHLTLDYRAIKEYWPENLDNLRDPSKIHLLPRAQAFAQKHDNARFSLLRIWSHPVFYPLTLGQESREDTCFQDTVGRCWEWNFLPKDMPTSEISMQKSVEDRLYGAALPKLGTGPRGQPMILPPSRAAPRFRQHFRSKTEVKRDMVLVMGEDEEDLERLTTAATFALQTNPWRLEIDFFKSFVNVDLAFLDGLDKKWLD